MKTLRISVTFTTVLATILAMLGGPASAKTDGDVSTGQKFTYSTEATAAYPPGCSGQLILYRTGNILTATTLSVCLSVQSRIWHKITLDRHRWYGWEPLIAVTDWRNNVSSFARDITYNCAGTGVHDFRARLQGQIVTPAGKILYGGAEDFLLEVNCG